MSVIYIFEDVDQVSWNWHADGGLAVIADDVASAKALIDGQSDVEVTDEEWKGVQFYPLAVDVEPKLFVFPDAGCC